MKPARPLISFRSYEECAEYLLEKARSLEYRIETLELVNKQYKPRIQTANSNWLNIDELQEYLPDFPAKATIYGWVGHNQIPFYKGGKKLRFLKSEIDEWLLSGKPQNEQERREQL